MKELTAPPAAKTDPNAQEVVRAWIVNNGLHCSLNVGVFGDNEAILWGIVLSDIARHVADARKKLEDVPLEESLRAIAESFMFEMRTPTAEPSGHFEKQ